MVGRYGTDRVEGDTPTTAAMLKEGDTIRSYSGLSDTLKVTGNSRQIAQGGSYHHSITYSDGSRSDFVPADQRYDLPTGPAREQERDEQGRFA